MPGCRPCGTYSKPAPKKKKVTKKATTAKKVTKKLTKPKAKAPVKRNCYNGRCYYSSSESDSSTCTCSSCYDSDSYSSSSSSSCGPCYRRSGGCRC